MCIFTLRLPYIMFRVYCMNEYDGFYAYMMCIVSVENMTNPCHTWPFIIFAYNRKNKCEYMMCSI